MAELTPAPFADLVTRLYEEPKAQDSLFVLPRRKWYVPEPAGRDLTVRFHGKVAGNASGPAAGPHTQMAQNILLSYVAGARILELKTVQVNDRLTIGRPCIDMTNVGYNIEWSQELLVPDSLREYVAGAMLIEMFRRDPAFCGDSLLGPSGEAILDLSVGYDLAGIKSEKVQKFLDGMRDASAEVEKLRAEIPAHYKFARDLKYPTHLSNTLTLSTFHGCPADEIERICEFLLIERDLDVIVKMNPPMLGKERLEHLLHDELGYKELTVNPDGLHFRPAVRRSRRPDRPDDETRRQPQPPLRPEILQHAGSAEPPHLFHPRQQGAVSLRSAALRDHAHAHRRLPPIGRPARAHQLQRRHRSGQFSARRRQRLRAGHGQQRSVAPGGYGRISTYLKSLDQWMQKVGAKNVDEYILKVFGQEGAAFDKAASDPHDKSPEAAVRWASLLNNTIAAEKARKDPRYRAEKNRKEPTRIDSHLVTFDCITCDKCLPVCPNAANFTYPTPVVAFDYQDLVVDSKGATRNGETKHFEITEKTQIACYSDFCNECGNCDTFCPEYGGPYIKKPTFYGSAKTWKEAAPRDGFYLECDKSTARIHGRMKGLEYELVSRRDAGEYDYRDAAVEATFRAADHSLVRVKPLGKLDRRTLRRPGRVPHAAAFTSRRARSAIRKSGELRRRLRSVSRHRLIDLAAGLAQRKSATYASFMQVTITAVGPDHRGLCDPIIHYVTGQGANISEIQMYDHDEAALFAMFCRVELESKHYAGLKPAMDEIGKQNGLSIRVWSPEARRTKPRLAICTTYRPEPALALLRAMRDGQVPAEAAVMIGNRPTCRSVAEQFGIKWEMIGDANGNPDDEKLTVAVRRARRRLPRAGPLHAHPLAGGLLEIRRRPHHQPAPRPAAQLSRHPSVQRSLRQPHAHLRRHLPLHRARFGRRQSDHLSKHLHCAAGHEAG